MTYIDDEFFGNTTAGQGMLSGDELQKLRTKQAELRRSGITKSLFAISQEDGTLDSKSLGFVADAATRLSINRIPGFSIREKIGAGGMGTVYCAVQRSLGKTVALKVLPPQLAESGQFVTRFLREAKALAKLNHPNVVQVIDAGEADGIYYFVMEYVDGPTCASIVRRDGPMSEARALNIVLQVVKALEHATKHGLVHRDIKPDNIMITEEGAAKLCDLGLVKSTRGDSKLTVQGIAMGTPHYISPEQARGNVDIDIRSDIYSLGISLYYLITGRLPFRGKTPGEVMRKHISASFKIPKNCLAKLSKGAAAVILKMAEKDRDKRYQTPAELRKDLELVKDGQPPLLASTMLVQDAVAPVDVGGEDEPDSPRGKMLWIYSAAGFVALVAVVIIVAFILGGRKPAVLPDSLGSGGPGIADITPGTGRKRPESTSPDTDEKEREEKLRKARELLEKARALAAQDGIYIESVIAGMKELYDSVPADTLSSDDMAELDALVAGLEGELTEDIQRAEDRIKNARSEITNGRFKKAMRTVAEARVQARSREAAGRADRAVKQMPDLISAAYLYARKAATGHCRIRNFEGAKKQLNPFRSTGIQSLDNAADRDYLAVGVAEKVSRNLKDATGKDDLAEKAAGEIIGELESEAEEKYALAMKLNESKKYLEAADAFRELIEFYGDTDFVKDRRSEIDSIRPRRGLVRYVTYKKKVLEVREVPQTGVTENIVLEGGDMAADINVYWEGYMMADRTARIKLMAYTQGKPYVKIGSITMKLYRVPGQEDAYEMKKHVMLSKSSLPRKVLIRINFDAKHEKRAVLGRWDKDREFPVPFDMSNCYYLPKQIPKVELKFKK